MVTGIEETLPGSLPARSVISPHPPSFPSLLFPSLPVFPSILLASLSSSLPQLLA